jgi:hypothetical protein
MYDQLLKGLAGPPPPGPSAAPTPGNTAALGVGMGDPPSMPGMPPKATGVGPVPTGDPGTTKKAAADQGVLALREAKGHFPNLAADIDRMIDQLKSAVSKSGPEPELGKPAPPGSPPNDVPPDDQSGTTGPL